MRSKLPVLWLAATLATAAGCQESSTTSNAGSSAVAESTTAAGAETGSAPAGGTAAPGTPAAADLTAAEKSMEVAFAGNRSATLRYTDLKIGDGSIADAGKTAMVHYTGWLTDGTKFDSSLDNGRPFQFRIGAVPPGVIEGWDKGVRGMRVGGKRKLVIPSDLGYGPRGYAGAIPPNATLVFEVELLGLQ
ncbi:MAG: FKBP-type peptidyl-prolyl cis-trans isomerase [Candidatus Eisenbacteria bacterium]